MYYTYMLRCKNNTIYTGIATDVKRRMEEHFAKSVKCAKYTRTHTPLKLEAVWESEGRVQASRLEFFIKKLSKVQKEKLILENDFSDLEKRIEKKDYRRINDIDYGY